jgi:hypothetical protein
MFLVEVILGFMQWFYPVGESTSSLGQLRRPRSGSFEVVSFILATNTTPLDILLHLGN